MARTVKERFKRRRIWISAAFTGGFVLFISATFQRSTVRAPWWAWVVVYVAWFLVTLTIAWGVVLLLRRGLKCPRCGESFAKVDASKLSSCPKCGLDFEQAYTSAPTNA
jgi:anaerobic ribonucleoside-triphosphate reductase